jgi:hypothetical protein
MAVADVQLGGEMHYGQEYMVQRMSHSYDYSSSLYLDRLVLLSGVIPAVIIDFVGKACSGMAVHPWHSKHQEGGLSSKSSTHPRLLSSSYFLRFGGCLGVSLQLRHGSNVCQSKSVQA